MSGDVVHRLGTTVGAVALLALSLILLGLAVRWPVAWRRERRVRRRMASLLEAAGASGMSGATGASDSTGTPKDRHAGPRFAPPGAVRRWLPVLGVVGAGCLLIGGPAGAVAGAVGAAALWRWRERATSPPDAGFDTVEAARQLPLAADLLAACVAAGAGPVVAAQAVGDALGGPVGEALARGAAEVRLGSGPADAWRGLASIPGAAALARLLERAGESGLPAAAPVARLAADARAERARTATARARRAAVLVTAPVGLCFLPAFVAVGVLPVVIGLAGGVLRGGGG
ncbi:type II secretion system F family protein [Streptomyces sp. NPDC047017]|uniref:type II secretion system F family protein n=1 Tax=Streptomyces sp. NPDC047017 TaxID=3155024 RepID=UPI0033CA2C22